ncbi:SPFH domain-containing protein [Streptomyces sp. NPDC090085]|uniref:SPFH domain-containing protein n=1 Tax=Streptomyces sp. NPDC090085 TaxID=3365943 RepID=UPI003819D79D
MYPTRTTSTTGTLRVPPAPAAPAPAVRASTTFGWAEATPPYGTALPASAAVPVPVPVPASAPVSVSEADSVPAPVPVPASGPVAWPAADPQPVPAARPEPEPERASGRDPWPSVAPRAGMPVALPAPAAPAPVPVPVPASAARDDAARPLPEPVTAVAAQGSASPPAGPGEGHPHAPEPGAAAGQAPSPAAGPGAPPAPGRFSAPRPAAQTAPAPAPVPVTGSGSWPPAAQAAPVSPPEELPELPEVPAARVRSEPEPVHAPAAPAAHGGREPYDPFDAAGPAPVLDIPHPQQEEPQPEAAAPPARGPEPDSPADARAAQPSPSGVPGPGVAEIVAQAVARGLDEDDTLDLPAVAAGAPHRGGAVTAVPLHLPFRDAAATLPVRGPAPAPAARRAPAAPATRTPRPAPGRRVPRGDDRLREHRGPVLPGWVGVAVGGLALAGCAAVLWRAGAVPDALLTAFGAAPRAYRGLHAAHWPPLAFLGIVALVALGGLGRARAGHAWVLTLFGRYRGTVRRTGLTWISPLLLRRRVDVRLRHWRSDPMPAVDSGGLALQVVVQVVWQVRDTARATLAVEDHTEYLAEQVESAMARVLSQLPADAFHEDAPTLRDAEAVGDALTRMLAAETEAVGIEVFSAQPTRIEYAEEVAEAMRRRRVAAIDAKHRDTVLSSVVDAVDDTVHRLTSRGLVELDDYERKALVKDLTVAFYTGRPE